MDINEKKIFGQIIKNIFKYVNKCQKCSLNLKNYNGRGDGVGT